MRKKFLLAMVATVVAVLANAATTEAQDYGRVVIKPRNAKIGAVPKLRNPPTRAPLEWVKDPDSHRLGLWSAASRKFIAVFVPAPSMDPNTPSDAYDYGTAKINPRTPRIGRVPAPRVPSTKPPLEWVQDPNSMKLGLRSQATGRFLAVFTPAPNASVVKAEPTAPSNEPTIQLAQNSQ